MTTNLFLDKRLDSRVKESPKLQQVKIAINHRGDTAYIGTGIRIPAEAWNASEKKVVKTYPNASRLNLSLATKKLDVDNAIEELRKKGRLKGLSLPKIRKAIIEYLSDDEEADGSELLVARIERYRDRKKKINT